MTVPLRGMKWMRRACQPGVFRFVSQASERAASNTLKSSSLIWMWRPSGRGTWQLATRYPPVDGHLCYADSAGKLSGGSVHDCASSRCV